mmetsp:Transcript_22924/g.36916  ORF Transcript_22924/g.36916 Transcript_22924/m.36916 type:complete len:87 (-) Transcript_22924:212-472(-)
MEGIKYKTEKNTLYRYEYPLEPKGDGDRLVFENDVEDGTEAIIYPQSVFIVAPIHWLIRLHTTKYFGNDHLQNLTLQPAPSHYESV